MQRWTVLVVLAMLWTMPRFATAHDGHVHKVMGTITVRDAKHLELRTPSGETLSIAITPQTTATRNKRRVALTEVQVGRRVVVAIGNGADPLKAGEIQVGATRID